jgi:hypothetical protein
LDSGFRDTDSFVLGDGSLTCVVELNRASGRGPYGILLGVPGRVARRESTLLWHPEHHLRRTLLTVVVDGARHSPDHESTSVEWDDDTGGVVIRWSAGPARVEERIAVTAAHVDRIVTVDAAGSGDIAIEAALYANPVLFDEFTNGEQSLTASGHHELRLVCLSPSRPFERFITAYRGERDTPGALRAHFVYSSDAFHHPRRRAIVAPRADASRIETQLRRSLHGLRAAIGSDGRFNASLFQYEFEWGLDAAMAARAVCVAGDHELGGAILENILSRLSNDEGMIAEAGRFRGGELSELNGNGAVLDAAWRHVLWSRDEELVRRHWQRLVAIAEYPLRDEFQHECGMLRTRRDFWERSPWQGVGDGFELGHQVLCSVGLTAASQLATLIGDSARAARWREAGARIRTAMLEHPTHRLIEDGRFVRRRRIDGSVERALVADRTWRRDEYAPYVPTSYDETPRSCEPDVTEVLPIIYGLVDARSDVALRTLDAIEGLWSPTGIGGYARYDIASEPDSPGPWPFATAMVAAAELEAGLDERADRSINWLLDAAGAGGSWLEYYGHRQTPPFPPTGIIVWGWAQYLILVIEHMLGVRIERGSLHSHARRAGIGHVLRIGTDRIELPLREPHV